MKRGPMSTENRSDLNAPPLNPLPPVVWALALPMIAVEVAANAGASGVIGGPDAIGWRSQLVQLFGFAPDYLRWMIETRQAPLDGLTRLVTYPLVHASVGHALFVVVILLALGKFVAEVYRWWAVLATFFLATIAGALAFAAVPMAHSGLLGGYPGVYGLIGAYSFLLWVRLVGSGENQMRAFRLIGFLLIFQVIIAVVGIVWYGVEQGTTWEFVADIAGFVTGFLVAFVVSPGGWTRVRAKLRAH
jgi:membrane associated rhomboid family serine protease